MGEINLSIRSMKYGLRVREDEVNEPAGSFRVMKNAIITDRGGISKRPGVSVLGDYDSSGEAVRGLVNYTKADGTEILVKALGTTHKYLDTTWENMETGLTASDHDYAPHIVNVDEDDYLYFSSKENGYKRWKGWFDRTTGVLAGGETEIPVTTVLKADIYYSDNASSSTSTTINVAGAPWGADQWDGLYVRITSGAQSGKISKITATIFNKITFDSISGLTGAVTFEIRRLDVTEIKTGSITAFADAGGGKVTVTSSSHGLVNGENITISGTTNYNGNFVVSNVATNTFEITDTWVSDDGTGIFSTFYYVLVNGTSVAYTSVTNDDSLTVASAPAAASGSVVVLVPTSYPLAPKCSALAIWETKMIAAGIKSSAATNAAGNVVATSNSRAVYVSSTKDAADFSFSAPRSADEGDVIEIAYGGGSVDDVIEQEDKIYAGTQDLIEEIEYIDITDPTTGVVTDTAKHSPVKPGIGLKGRFVKGKDDVYFFTPAGELTSIGRVSGVDTRPQSLDIGLKVRRLLADRVFDRSRGVEWRNRLYLAHKLDSNSTHNDRILIYNRGLEAFEGDWLLPASELAIWDGKPIFGQANGGNVLKMHNGTVDTWDSVDYPIVTEVKSNWINVTPSGMEDQSLVGVHVAGWIRGNSEFDFKIYIDYSEDEALTINFKGSESDFVYQPSITAFLGGNPLGLTPLGGIESVNSDGNYRFRFTFWFPDIYCNVLSWGFKAYGKDEYAELSQVGFTVSADPLSVGPGLIKS